jgi:uncharacterized protein YegL
MSEGREKIYNQGIQKEIKDQEIKIDIPQEDWETIKIIAKRVGGDFGMEVKLGNPGEGSFFNPIDCSITFDPLHIKDNLEEAKFTAGHEGAHRAITPGPEKIGLSQEQVRELYSQIGFGYLQNVIEDPAVNDWMCKRFPGLKEYTKKVYDEEFKKENSILSTPEVAKIALQLGYWPKFAQYGSEVIRDWHQKRFSEKLDPAVKIALKRTIDYVRESIATIPDPQKLNQDNKEIIVAGQKRFEKNTNYIWPEVKKLVEMDLRTEEKRQMLKEFMQKQKELEQKRKELEQTKKENNQQKQQELEKEIKDLEKELKPFNELQEDIKKELQEQIDKAIKEAAKQLNKEIEQRQKQIEETKQKQQELDKEIKDLEEKAKSSSGKEKEELDKKLQEKKAEKLSQEMKQKQAEQELKEIQDTLKNIQSGDGMPYPEDKLSEDTKKELEKLFNKLPKQKQEELKDKAKRQLEDFEDEVNKELQGKLNKDNPETHKEIREREIKEREIQERKEKEEKEKEELQKKLEKIRKEQMNEYDKAYEEVVDIINSLYNRLKKFFLPERHPKWQKGFPTGSRLDLGKAMQAEADPRYFKEIWERKTIPHKLDYRFSVLVDLSGSMEGEKIEETFKGVVVLAEVLEKLGIQYEIIGFSDQVKTLKEWKEKLDKEKRDQLTVMKISVRGNTHTDKATKFAIEHIEKNKGKNNFILTLTDGEPYPDVHSNRLRNILKEIKNKNIKIVGVGLGPDTEFVKDYYPAYLYLPNIKPKEQHKKEGEKDFAEAFADLLEDMIKHPEKYD